MAYEEVMRISGDILMAILGISSGISAIILIIEVLKSDELRMRKKARRLLKNLKQSDYLKTSPEMLKDKNFLFSYEDDGINLCNNGARKIVIDESYSIHNNPYLPD